MRIQGLARLLVLEKLATAQDREGYLQSRRQIRGRPQPVDAWRRLLKRKYKGDLKNDADSGLEMSDYDVVSLHIPYGPGWDARRIEKLVYSTDLGMNCMFTSECGLFLTNSPHHSSVQPEEQGQATPSPHCVLRYHAGMSRGLLRG